MFCPNCRVDVILTPDNNGRILCANCGHLLKDVNDETTKIRLTPPPGTGRTMAPMTHDLKIQSKYFDAIASGEKRFEVRKNDRFYQVGDILRLHEIPKPGQKEGRTTEVEVTYILHGGLPGVDADHCVLSIRATHLMEDYQFEAQIIIDQATDLEEKSEALLEEAEKGLKE